MTDPTLSIRDVISHPVSFATTILTAAVHLLHLGPIDAFAGVVWAQIASIFTALSIFAFTVLPNIQVPVQFGWLPGAFRVGAIIAGVVYAAKILERVWDRVQKKL